MTQFDVRLHFINGTKQILRLEAEKEEEVLNRVIAKDWLQYFDVDDKFYIR
ncbi:hypothetical protein [Paenibacillus gansuensis]|uniref:Uncharacterized protein n=1 Tax=Paenibacillus gansuensis TaxID=306542 RepID=A0ABW5PGY2_9BACL